jgi:ferredoxin
MVEIKKDLCVGCSICKNICPDGIDVINGKASIKNENSKCLKQAADACPRNAIILDEKSNNSLNRNTQQQYQKGQGRGIGAGRGRGLGGGPRDGRGQGRGGGGRRRW